MALLKVLPVTERELCGGMGAAGDEERARDYIRQRLGRAGEEALERMAALSDHHRAILAGRIVGWADALEEYERRQQLPITPMDLERERARLSAKVAKVSEAKTPVPRLPARARKRRPGAGGTGDPAR